MVVNKKSTDKGKATVKGKTNKKSVKSPKEISTKGKSKISYDDIDNSIDNQNDDVNDDVNDDANDNIEDIDDATEYDEIFFNEDSYNTFIKKYNLTFLDKDNYVSNDLHQVDIITPNDKRITSEIMTLAEYTRVLSERSKQIENGSDIFIDYGDEDNIQKIAIMEIQQKKCPLEITRRINKNIIEVWQVNDMIIPFR